jgi:hypothetical protein
MAYVAKPLEDDKETLQGQEGEGVKTLNTGGDALSPGGSPQEGVSTNVGAPQGQKPQGGQDLSQQQAYLDANREKSLQLAGKTGDIIRGDVTKAQTGLTGAGDTYKKAVQGGTVNLDQDLYGRASSALVDQTAPTYNVDLTNQFMANQADQDLFKSLYNAQYGGPTDIYSQDYYAQAARDAAKAQRTMGLVGDATGRQELIARTYENPSGRFNRGVLALDESLLTGYEDAYNQLMQAADTGLGLEGQMKSLGEMSQQEYEQAVATTQATKDAMRKQFNLSGEEGEIRTSTEAIKDKAKKDYEDYMKYIQDTYGVKEGVQATQYFDRPQDYVNIQAQNVMSQSDVARMKALESLTGGVGTLTPFEAQAGQYKDYIDPSQDFRLSDFQAKVDSEKVARLKREADEKARLQAIADAQAAADAAAKEAQKQSTGTAIGAVGGAAIGGSVGGPVGAVIGGAIGGAIGSVFCFDPNTLVQMVDGSSKKISDVKVGDVLNKGGEVYTISSHLNKDPMFDYGGVLVSGSHAVKEDGKWKRVKDANHSRNTDKIIPVIHSLSCKNHIIMINDNIFADFDELDNSQGLTDEQCLKILNRGI